MIELSWNGCDANKTVCWTFYSFQSYRPFLNHFLTHVQQHRSIIAAFGRYPQRNAILNRNSTEAELQFLAELAKNNGRLPESFKIDTSSASFDRMGQDEQQQQEEEQLPKKPKVLYKPSTRSLKFKFKRRSAETAIKQ